MPSQANGKKRLGVWALAVRVRFLVSLLLGLPVPVHAATAEPGEWALAGAELPSGCASPALTYFTTASGDRVEANRLEFSAEAVDWTQRAFFSDGSLVFESTIALTFDAPRSLSSDATEMRISGTFASRAATQGAGGGLTYELSAEGADLSGVDGPVRIDAANAKDERTLQIAPTADEVTLSLRVRSSSCAVTWRWLRTGVASVATGGATPVATATPVGEVPPIEDCAPGVSVTGRARLRDGIAEVFDPGTKRWSRLDAEGIEVRPCMKVRTSENSRVDYFVHDAGGDVRLVLSGNSLVEARSTDRGVNVLSGALYVSRPEVGDPSEGAAVPYFDLGGTRVMVAAPTEWIEFILYRDASTSASAVLLKRGKLDVDAGGRRLNLSAGQVLWSAEGTDEPIRAISDDVWRELSQARSAAEFVAAVVSTRDLPELSPAPPAPSTDTQPNDDLTLAGSQLETGEAEAPPAAAVSPTAADCADDPTGWAEPSEHSDPGSVEVYDEETKTWTTTDSRRSLSPCMLVRVKSPIARYGIGGLEGFEILVRKGTVAAPSPDRRVRLSDGEFFGNGSGDAGTGAAPMTYTFELPTISLGMTVPLGSQGIAFFVLHDEASELEVVVVEKGELAVSTGGQFRLILRAGQSIRVEGGVIDDVRDATSLIEERADLSDLASKTKNLPIAGSASAETTSAPAEEPAAPHRIVLSVSLLPPSQTEPGRPRFGVRLATAAELDASFFKVFGMNGPQGSFVYDVTDGSPAELVGIEPGDVIIRVGHRSVWDADSLVRVIQEAPFSVPMEVEVIRYGRGADDLLTRLRADADRGDVDALVMLGALNYAEFDGRRDVAEALRLYTLAGEKGSGFAAYRLGTIYSTGSDVSIDYAKATRWYVLEAQYGEDAAEFQIGYLYWTGNYWRSGRSVRDDATAVGRFRAAAQGQDIRSYFYLGAAYDLGRGVATDHAEAARWYRRSIEALRDPESMANLGRLHYLGSGVTQDYSEARGLFADAMAAGDNDARYWLGLMYRDGLGVAADKKKAVALFREASDAGIPEADYMLAVAYVTGSGVSRDEAQAGRYLIRAIVRGDDFAINEMKTNSNAWPVEVRLDIQRMLEQRGHYQGSIDADFGPATLRAIDALAAAGGH
jgi:TPR repeat protein